jgi:hypothetical protein
MATRCQSLVKILYVIEVDLVKLKLWTRKVLPFGQFLQLQGVFFGLFDMLIIRSFFEQKVSDNFGDSPKLVHFQKQHKKISYSTVVPKFFYKI